MLISHVYILKKKKKKVTVKYVGKQMNVSLKRLKIIIISFPPSYYFNS